MAAPKKLYSQPSVRLRVWGIDCPELDPTTGSPVSEQRGDYGIDFDLHIGAPADKAYEINGVVDRNVFMTTLEIAKVRQMKRIARALEKLAGLEHDEPEDYTVPKNPKET